MQKYRFLIIWIIFKGYPSFATGQAPDYLVVDADTFSLFTLPLETLPEKAKVASEFFNDSQTDCWRGYIGYWQLIGTKLYLTNIISCSSDNKKTVPLTALFGVQCKEGRVFADWVTDELICPKGKLLRYYPDGYGSIYEYETIYQVRQGVLSGKSVFDNRKTKISIYEKDPEKLKKFIYGHIAWNKLPALPPDSVVKVFVNIKSSPQGKTPAIKVLRGAGTLWDTEALRVMRLLPEWSVDYVKGKYRSTSYNTPIWFSEVQRKQYAQRR